MESAKEKAACAAFTHWLEPLLLGGTGPSVHRALGEIAHGETLVLGIGSGSTIVHLIQRLAAFVQAAGDEVEAEPTAVHATTGTTGATTTGTTTTRPTTKIRPFVCIPTSFQSRQLLVEAGLPVGDLERYPRVHVTVDGADEVDAHLNCIKGGGGCHAQEKVVAANSRCLVLVADQRKRSTVLATNVRPHVPGRRTARARERGPADSLIS